MRFSKDNQPPSKGRPKGSRNKRSIISDQLHQTALEKLTQAVNEGESWAIQAILDRTMPRLKPGTDCGSLEAELIQSQTELNRLKALEISEFEQRLKALESEGRKR